MNEISLKPILVSELESYYRGFIEFKRSTGLKYTGEERALKYFAKYCCAQYHEYIPEEAKVETL